MVVESELEEVVEQETLEETGDPDFNSDAPFDSDAWNADVGLGGGAGGKMGGRGGRGGRGGKNPQEAAVLDALKWLHDHQAPSGFWDSDEFFLYDVYDDKATSTGKGNPVNDVGLTGLSLLAFLGNGNTLSSGKYKDTVSSGIRWLKEVQREDGLFGDEVGNPTLYNHSIATMAMGEAYYFSKLSPTLKRPMKNAVKVIVNARDPYGAWRYKLESNGDQDTSITGWMVLAEDRRRLQDPGRQRRLRGRGDLVRHDRRQEHRPCRLRVGSGPRFAALAPGALHRQVPGGEVGVADCGRVAVADLHDRHRRGQELVRSPQLRDAQQARQAACCEAPEVG